MAKKHAVVYARVDAIVVATYDATNAGLWIVASAVRIDARCTDRELGAAVRAALDASRADVAHPTQWAGLTKPLLHAASVRSYKAFASGARSVGIDDVDGALTITPSRNLGPRDGFEDLAGVPFASDGHAASLGAAVRAALAACQ